jgi:predicted fused transcriptional regulator/phosphomethylpyrimidine kinase
LNNSHKLRSVINFVYKRKIITNFKKLYFISGMKKKEQLVLVKGIQEKNIKCFIDIVKRLIIFETICFLLKMTYNLRQMEKVK